MSIGKTVQGQILMAPEMSNQELLDWTLEKFPAAKTSLKCIAWYKSDLRKKGLLAKRGAESDNEQMAYLEKRLAELKAKQQ